MIRDSFATARPPLRQLAGATAVSMLLAGCAAAPLSFLNDEQVTQRAQLYRFPVTITAVDGHSTGFRPVPISPGEHLVTMDAPPVGGLTQPVQKTFAMRIEPCTRYYVAAQRDAAFHQDWQLVIEDEMPVGGCHPDDEWHKARAEARASGAIGPAPASPASSAAH